MGDNVIQLPRRHYDRASAGSRAANAVISSAVRPADLATSVARIADHHSAGMLSRCSHLREAAGVAPIAMAIASAEPHSPITARNDVGVTIMESCLGQLVLNGKSNLSYDYGEAFRDNAGMTERMSETEETLAYIARVRAARIAKFATQKPVYSYLDIPQDTYKHYEVIPATGKGRPMPMRYIPKFCLITEISVEWLLTGEGKGPAQEDIPKKLEPRAARRRRAA